MSATTGQASFVGRDRELETLRQAFAEARDGRGRVVLLSGEPGIGKTRTADELAAWAGTAGAEVLVGRCYEGEGAPAFWPWLQVLRSYVAARDPARLEAELGPAAPDLAAVVPEVAAVLPGRSRAASPDPEQARFRFFEGTSACLRRAAETCPIVLVLDDLHGADKSSLLLLQFLAREIGRARVLIVGAHRDLEVVPGHPLAETLGELRRERVVRHLPLPGLTTGDVAELMARVAGTPPPPELAAMVRDKTEGNPLYVTEIAATLAGAAPPGPGSIALSPSLRIAIGRRLEGLVADCRDLLVLAGLFGREFDVETLGRAAGLEPRAVVALLDEAAAARVALPIEGNTRRWRFSHALFGEVPVQALGLARRAELHCRAAQALAAHPRAEELATEIAHHWMQAGPAGEPARAVEWARRAGDRALALFAHEEAARHYGLALTAMGWLAGPDPAREAELLLALGEAHKRAGEVEEARTAFLRAAALARRLGSAEILTRAALGFAPAHMLADRPDPDPALVTLLEEAIAAWQGRDGALHARAPWRGSAWRTSSVSMVASDARRCTTPPSPWHGGSAIPRPSATRSPGASTRAGASRASRTTSRPQLT
jgi:predicted ATPase